MLDICVYRFSNELADSRPNLSFIPFGLGPRKCIGERFALLETKMALVQLLYKYTLHRCEQTEVPVTINKSEIVTPSNGVYVRLQRN